MRTTQEASILDKIKTRGYWKIAIHPSSFQGNLIEDRTKLFDIVRTCSVRYRLWDYPHINLSGNLCENDAWIGQDYDRHGLFETWRLHQSGLFVHHRAIEDDWEDETNSERSDSDEPTDRILHYLSTIYTFLEIFEFASRLSRSPAGTDFMRVNIELHGLSERRLVETDIRFLLPNRYISNQPDWTFNQTYSFIDLTTQSRDFAAHAARELFVIFGYDVSIESLKRIQDLLVRR